MIRRRRPHWLAAALLCVLWTTRPGAEAPRHPSDSRKELNITVTGDIEDVVLTDPLGRSNRDSSGYVLGDIPDCVRDDVTEENDELPDSVEPHAPTAMMLSLLDPPQGSYRLEGRARTRTPVGIDALYFRGAGAPCAHQWGGHVQGKVAWRIVVSGKSDSCRVSVQRIAQRRLPPASRRR